MITKELIERINFLAKKKRESGLSPEEEKEQAEVRKEYIEGIKSQLRPMLEEYKQGDRRSDVHPGNCTCGHCKQ